MPEQTPIPEPPDGSHILLGEAPLQVLLICDEESAAATRKVDPDLPEDFRWFLSTDGDPLSWALATDATVNPLTLGLPQGLNRTVMLRLFTPEEVAQAVADGGYEQIGEHQIALGPGRCVVHGETYAPMELDRLREREGGRDG